MEETLENQLLVMSAGKIDLPLSSGTQQTNGYLWNEHKMLLKSAENSARSISSDPPRPHISMPSHDNNVSTENLSLGKIM